MTRVWQGEIVLKKSMCACVDGEGQDRKKTEGHLSEGAETVVTGFWMLNIRADI